MSAEPIQRSETMSKDKLDKRSDEKKNLSKHPAATYGLGQRPWRPDKKGN
jgi:hypothetical protein